MKTYISLKDLPGAPKGTEWIRYGTRPLYETKNREGAFGGTLNLNFNEEFILSNPEWWEEKRLETLEDVVKEILDGKWDLRQLDKLRAVYNRIKSEGK